MKKQLVTALITAIVFNSISAQLGKGFHFGVGGGVMFTKISELKRTIVGSEECPFKDSPQWGAFGGPFVTWKTEKEIIAFHGEATISGQGSKAEHTSTATETTSKLNLKYDYFNLLGMVKFTPWASEGTWASGISVNLGYQTGFPITPSRIKYESVPADYVNDPVTQGNWRNTLEAVSNHSIVFGLGYEFMLLGWTNVIVEGRWDAGFKDAITVTSNRTYPAQDRHNRVDAFRLAISVSLASYAN